MLLKNILMLFCLCCTLPLSSTPTKRNRKARQPILVIGSKKETRLWDLAEQGKGEKFIHFYINKGGKLRFTNEYGETAVKVLMKQSSNHN